MMNRFSLGASLFVGSFVGGMAWLVTLLLSKEYDVGLVYYTVWKQPDKFGWVIPLSSLMFFATMMVSLWLMYGGDDVRREDEP